MRIVALALTFAMSGCAMVGGNTVEESSGGVERASAPPPAVAQARVHAGDTKAQVLAALGPANVLAFDSGYEVWVYRWLAGDRSARSATELVLLVGPDGTVRKSRVRAGVAG